MTNICHVRVGLHATATYAAKIQTCKR